MMIPARCGRMESLAWGVATVAALLLCALALPVAAAAWLAGAAHGRISDAADAASRRRRG